MSKFRPAEATATALPAGTDACDFALALLAGLSATPKRIPCKYFYDAAGSALFEQICALPEYYVTRTELELLTRHAGEFAALSGADAESSSLAPGLDRRCGCCLTRSSARGPICPSTYRAIIWRRLRPSSMRTIPA